MHVVELAEELRVKPEKLAQRTEALGLGTLDPETELTPQQEAALRASFPPPASRGKKMAIVGGSVAAFAAVIGFFMMQSSSAEDRRDQQSADLAGWQEAPPATVAPEAKAEAGVRQDVPRDRERFCAAWATVNEQEASAPEIDGLQEDFTSYRKWAADRSAWRAAIDEAAATGPPDGIPDHRNYRDVQLRYYNALVNASDSDLRGLADGIELNGLENWERDVTNAVRPLKGHVNPHCGDVIG